MKTGLRIALALLALSGAVDCRGAGVVLGPDLPTTELEQRWAQPPSTFIEVQGLRVHLRDEGPRDDPTPSCWSTARQPACTPGTAGRELRTTRRVIRFDLPGFGLTGPNAADDYSMAVYVRLVLALLDQLGCSGSSLAAIRSVARWPGPRHAAPQRVEKLILVDAAGYAFEPESMPLAFRVAHTGPER